MAPPKRGKCVCKTPHLIGKGKARRCKKCSGTLWGTLEEVGKAAISDVKKIGKYASKHPEQVERVAETARKFIKGSGVAKKHCKCSVPRPGSKRKTRCTKCGGSILGNIVKYGKQALRGVKTAAKKVASTVKSSAIRGYNKVQEVYKKLRPKNLGSAQGSTYDKYWSAERPNKIWSSKAAFRKSPEFFDAVSDQVRNVRATATAPSTHVTETLDSIIRNNRMIPYNRYSPAQQQESLRTIAQQANSMIPSAPQRLARSVKEYGQTGLRNIKKVASIAKRDASNYLLNTAANAANQLVQTPQAQQVLSNAAMNTISNPQVQQHALQQFKQVARYEASSRPFGVRHALKYAIGTGRKRKYNRRYYLF